MSKSITQARLCAFYDRILHHLWRGHPNKMMLHDVLKTVVGGITDYDRLKAYRAGYSATDEGVRRAALEFIHTRDASQRRIEQMRRIQVAYDVSGLEPEIVEWCGLTYQQSRQVEEFAILDRDMEALREERLHVVRFFVDRIEDRSLQLWQYVRDNTASTGSWQKVTVAMLTQAAPLFVWARLETVAGAPELMLYLGDDRDLSHYRVMFCACPENLEPMG